MEIYRNDLAQIKLTVPVTAIDGTFVVKATDGATVLYTFPTVSAITGGYQVTLPFSLVDKDRTFTIEWAFDYAGGSYTAKTLIEVVTPYVTVDEIREALGTMPPTTDAELKRIERRIRGVIETFTGQKFGKYSGAYKIQSTGDEDLTLPARLINLTGVAGAPYTDIAYYGTRGDGWYLGTAPGSLYVNGTYVAQGVITYPGSCLTSPWRDNVVYTITGDWGYEDVPANVKEAALIMIEDAICPTSEYRDRYIDMVKTANFQYTYTTNAFRGTGSVIADQLLEPYRRPTLAVI